MMVLIFALQKHIPLQVINSLVRTMAAIIQTEDTSASLKSYIFITLEFVFSETKFPPQTLNTLIAAFFNAEDVLCDHLQDKSFVVSFLRAFLQVLLNYHSQSPTDTKRFIPAFLGVIFELFADPNEEEFEEELSDEEVGVDQLGQGGHPKPKPPINASQLATQKSYSALAEKVFTMLVESTFDEELFADLENNPDAQLVDLFANLDFSRQVGGRLGNKSGPATTSSKIFALMGYALSPRFTASRPFVCKVLKMMLHKIGTLQLEFSNRFHEGLGTMAAELAGLKESGKEADALLGQVFELGDLEIVFNALSERLGLDVSDPDILNREEFTHLLYIFGKHCKALNFVFFVRYLLPLLQRLLEKPADARSQMEAIIIRKLFLAVGGFRSFEQIFESTQEDIQHVSHIILTDLLALADSLSPLRPAFYAMLQRFLLAAQELPTSGPKAMIRDTVVAQIRASNLLGKFCGKIAKPSRTVLEENCLQLVARVLPRDYIDTVFQKNANRLIRLLAVPDKVNKALNEGIILGFICKSAGQLFRDDQIFRLLMTFIEHLLSLKIVTEQQGNPLAKARAADRKRWILQGSCLALKLLTFLVPKVHWKLYHQLLSAAQRSVRSETFNQEIKEEANSLQIESPAGTQAKSKQTVKKKELFLTKHDQHALKFCVELMRSAKLNMDPKTGINDTQTVNSERAKLLKNLAQSFLPVAMVNIKTRNVKTRAYAKQVLKAVVAFEHSDLKSRQPLQIQATSLSVSSVIAGLAGASPYVRSCAVQALAYIYKGFFNQFDRELKQGLFEVVMLLGKQSNKEVFFSVLKFLKTYSKLENADTLRNNLPILKFSIFNPQNSFVSTFRIIVKGILGILMRKLSQTEAYQLAGEHLLNLAKYVATLASRRNRRSGDHNRPKYFDPDQLQEEDIVKDNNLAEDFDVREFLHGKKSEFRQKKKLANNSFNGFVEQIFKRYLAGSLKTEEPVVSNRIQLEEEDSDNETSPDPEPLFNDAYIRRFFKEGLDSKSKTGSAAPKLPLAKPTKSNKKKEVYFDTDTGRLIVKPIQAQPKLSGKRDFSNFTDGTPGPKGVRRKRPMVFASKRIRENEEAKYVKIIEKVTKPNKFRNKYVHNVEESGRKFKAKGGGDAKIKNKLSPHAFIQFNPIAISKKLRMKAKKAFAVIGGGKKKTSGALKNLRVK